MCPLLLEKGVNLLVRLALLLLLLLLLRSSLMPSFFYVLAKRKQDDYAEVLSPKKSRALMSLHALRQAVGLTPGSTHPSILQDLPSAVEAPTPAIFVIATPAPPPPLVVPIREVTSTNEVGALTILDGYVTASSPTAATPLLSVGVATTIASMIPPSPSSAHSVPPSVALAAKSPSPSSPPHVSLDHLYTSTNVDSLWGANYKPK